jgi:hypothetical protein
MDDPARSVYIGWRIPPCDEDTQISPQHSGNDDDYDDDDDDDDNNNNLL